jgi:low affinity Fe/Cu permease
MTFKQRFTKFAHWTAHASGQPITFILAILIVVGWVLTGPIFNYSDTWQLVINTGTTVVTFLMVFLIQNTQNRDTGAIQVKLDELVRALKGARNELIDLENIDEEDLERIRKEYEKIAEKARQLQSRKSIKPKD